MEQTRTATGDGGSEITLRLTAAEAEHLGDDAEMMTAWLARALWAVADLRAGRTREAWWPVVMDTAMLRDRLAGVVDAAIREAGPDELSHGQLAHWLDIPRSTVQSRRAAGTLPPAVPSDAETWARSGAGLDS